MKRLILRVLFLFPIMLAMTAGRCAPPIVNLGNDTTICSNATITLDAGNPGATSYLWSTGETTQTIVASASGEYFVEVDVAGEIGKDTIFISAYSTPVVNLPPTLDVCDEGMPATLDAGNPGSTFEWSTGETTQTIDVYFPDQYWVKVTNSNGCITNDTVLVDFVPPIKANFGYTPAGSCLPQSVQFHDSTTSCSSSPMGYSWNFGDGTTSTEVEPNHIYTTAGTFVVKLRITNDNGALVQKSKPVNITAVPPPVVNLPPTLDVCDEGMPATLDAGNPGSTFEWSTGETTQTIDVYFPDQYWVKVTNSSGCITKDTVLVDFIAPIKPNFGYTPAGSCLPQTVQFHDSSTSCSASPMHYLWDFGDGTSSTQAEPTHIYTTAGTFVVKLRVTNDNGALVQKSKPVNITAVSPPTVDLGNDTTICKGSGIVLDAANAGLTYLWSTGASSQTIPATAGTYFVAVTNAQGCVGKDTVIIKDTSYIAVGFTDIHSGLCIPATVDFSDTSYVCGTSPAEWAWDFGDGGTSTQQSPQHDYSTNGTYIVKLDIKDTSGITYTYSRSVVVNNIAMPVVDLGVDTLACGNLVLDAGNPGMTYQWNTGESASQIEILESGTFDVTVTNAAGCTKSDTIDVVIQQNVVPGFKYQTSGHCNNTVQFTDTSVICHSISITGWQWTFGDGTTSNDQHPIHTYNANGTFAVKLTMSDNVGGVISKTKPVVIQGSAPVVDLGADADLCPGDSIELSAENIEAKYNWTPSSLATDSTIGTVNVRPAADQWVAVTVTGCFQSVTDSILVHINTNPKPAIAKEATTLQSTTAYEYLWYLNGSEIGSATSKSYSPKGAGYYQVKTFNSFGCPSISDSVFFLPSGKFKTDQIVVKVSPNPTRGIFTIYLSSVPDKPIKTDIFSVEGRLVHSTRIHDHINLINPGPIRKGYYAVRLTVNGKFIVIPVTVL